MTKTRELESTKAFFFFPGKYCLYIHNSSEAALQDFNYEVSCLPFINHRSFAYAKGEFIPIKEYDITAIGYFNIYGIEFAPKTYFIGGNYWEDIAFVTMFIIGAVWIILLSWRIRKL